MNTAEEEALLEKYKDYIDGVDDDDADEDDDCPHYADESFEDAESEGEVVEGDIDDGEGSNGKEREEEGYMDFFTEDSFSQWHALDMTDDLPLAKSVGFIAPSPSPTKKSQTSLKPHASNSSDDVTSSIDVIKNEYRALTAYLSEEDSHRDVKEVRKLDKGKKKTAPKVKQKKEKSSRASKIVKEAIEAEEIFEERGKGKTENLTSKQPLTEAEERHRQLLRAIALKRKEDEELAIQAAIKAAIRRKKFKGKTSFPTSYSPHFLKVFFLLYSLALSDALLEKALRARTNCNDVGHELKNETLKSEGKGAQDAETGADDVDNLEEEKRAQIALIRRKFKEQHKKALQDLVSKNREDDLKEEMKKREEERKKDAHRQKVEKILSMKRERTEKDNFDNHDDDDDGDNERVDSQVAVGSGLAAIRSQLQTQQRVKPSSKNVDETQTMAPQNEEEEDDLAIEQRKLKRIQAKLQQAKVSSFLNALAERRKAEDAAKKSKEDRVKRRAALLQERVLLEAAERKLMNSEDKYRYRPSTLLNDAKEAQDTKVGSANALKVTPEMAEALSNRLMARQFKMEDGVELSVPARDYSDWKRKNGVPADGLVFVMTGWYPCVKQALLDRGWYFNADPTSPFCDLKWTLRSIDISQETLLPWQLTNHFLKNIAITTKAGIIKCLNSLVWLADVR